MELEECRKVCQGVEAVQQDEEVYKRVLRQQYYPENKNQRCPPLNFLPYDGNVDCDDRDKGKSHEDLHCHIGLVVVDQHAVDDLHLLHCVVDGHLHHSLHDLPHVLMVIMENKARHEGLIWWETDKRLLSTTYDVQIKSKLLY